MVLFIFMCMCVRPRAIKRLFRMQEEALGKVWKSLNPFYPKDRKSTIPMLTRAPSIILCPRSSPIICPPLSTFSSA